MQMTPTSKFTSHNDYHWLLIVIWAKVCFKKMTMVGSHVMHANKKQWKPIFIKV